MNSNTLTSLFRFPAGLLLALIMAATSNLARSQESAPAPAAISANSAATALSREDQERETDKQHLRLIYKAIQAYREKHGELPNWLSDLVPDFIADTNILMSPVELRTGRSSLFGYDDPKIKTSYIYEFNQKDTGRQGDQGVSLTMKQWKMRQMEEFGPVVPLLRCHLHQPIVNLSYSGEIYETAVFWETDNNTVALMARLGPGPGAREAEQLRVAVLDAVSGEPIPAAEVDASNRESEFGPVPPRHLTADQKGLCEVNLGGKSPKGVRLRVGKPGYASVQEQWGEGNIPETWTVRLAKAVTVGGLVKDTQGKSVAGVTVTLSGSQPDSAGQGTRAEYDVVRTDASGKWSSQRVPTGFDSLSLSLSHPEFVPVEYEQAASPNAAGKVVSKENLLAGTAEMQIQPGTVVEGKVQDEKGQPVAQAQVLLQISKDEETTSKRLQSDAAGRFRFVVTTTGTATLMAEARGLAPSHRALPQLEGQPALDPVTLTLPKGRTVQGRVVDADGKPVAGASITVLAWNNVAPLQWHTESDTNGRFAWDAAPSEPTRLRFSKSDFRDKVEALPSAETREWSVRLDKPLVFSGTVLDPDGKPAPKVTVFVFPFGAGESRTDAQGRFTLNAQPVPTGFGTADRVFIARDPDHNLAAIADFDEDAPKATLRLSPGLTLAGRVTDVNGQALSNAQVRVMFRSDRVSMTSGSAIRADAQGRFEIKALPPGRRYGVVASADGFGQDTLNVDAPETGGQRIELDPVQLLVADQRIAGVLLDNDDKPVAGAQISVYGEKQPNLQGKTDSQGRFAFDKVCSGTIRFYAYTQRGGYANGTVEAGDTNATIHLGSSSAAFFSQANQPRSLKGKPLPDLAPLGLTAADTPAGQSVLALLIDAEQRPSRRALRSLADQATALKEKGIAVIVLQSGDMSDDAFAAWKQEAAVPFPIGCVKANAEKVRTTWGAAALPWFILTGKSHRIAAEGFALDELEAKLQSIKD